MIQDSCGQHSKAYGDKHFPAMPIWYTLLSS